MHMRTVQLSNMLRRTCSRCGRAGAWASVDSVTFPESCGVTNIAGGKTDELVLGCGDADSEIVSDVATEVASADVVEVASDAGGNSELAITNPVLPILAFSGTTSPNEPSRTGVRVCSVGRTRGGD